MFSAPTAPPAARGHLYAGAYRQVAAQTLVAGASPHKLIALLFDGFFAAANQARGAMRDHNLQVKGRAIGSASRIIEEGLRSALNMKDGGLIAADLNNLYGYVGQRLMQANLRNDESAIEECLRLIKQVRDAWAEIGPQVESGGLRN